MLVSSQNEGLSLQKSMTNTRHYCYIGIIIIIIIVIIGASLRQCLVLLITQSTAFQVGLSAGDCVREN
jgi:FtsH-binding integral membrane protein